MIVNPVDSFNSTYQFIFNNTNQPNQNINRSFNEEKWAGNMLKKVIEIRVKFRKFEINKTSYFIMYAKKIGVRFTRNSVRMKIWNQTQPHHIVLLLPHSLLTP